MKKYEANAIRNVCLLSHGGVGKTSLLEAACFTSKGTAKLNKVNNGTSIFDSRLDEKERKMTITMKLGFCEWNNTKINFLDTPGFLDLQGDAKAALRVVESAVILVSALDGVQVGTELVSRFVEEAKTPKLFFVNGMDKDNVDFDKTLANLRETYGTSVAALAIPMGTGASFKGIVDLVNKEAYEYVREGNGMGKKIDIPADLAGKVDELRSSLMESVAETDEALMNKYFEKGELTLDELKQGLAKGFLDGSIAPLLSGSATLNMGTDVLLNMIVSLCPSPLSRKEVEVMAGEEKKNVPVSESMPVAAFVFKTLSEEHIGDFNCVRVFAGKLTVGKDVQNVKRNSSERISNTYFLRGSERVDAPEIGFGDIGALLKMKDTHTNDTLADKAVTYAFAPIKFSEPLVNVAVSSKNKGDEDKVGLGFVKIHEEDPTFIYKYHSDIRQTILSAMGDVHIDIILTALKHRFKVEVEKKQPKISYRETITKTVKYVEYTHKKQSGGAGQYAKVAIDLEPQPRGGGYEFVDKIVGGVIDQSFRPSVDKGIHAKLEEGILAGYPIVDLRVYLVDGKTHPVDSKDIAFQIAGREVFKIAFEQAGPILLEPISDMRITVPDEYTGDVMGDLSSRRGKIGGMEPEGKFQSVVAKVPEAEVQNYSQALRALSQGRGYFTKAFSHYEPVPAEVAKKIIEASRQTAEEVEE
jgi:elongation factor G